MDVTFHLTTNKASSGDANTDTDTDNDSSSDSDTDDDLPEDAEPDPINPNPQAEGNNTETQVTNSETRNSKSEPQAKPPESGPLQAVGKLWSDLWTPQKAINNNQATDSVNDLVPSDAGVPSGSETDGSEIDDDYNDPYAGWITLDTETRDSSKSGRIRAIADTGNTTGHNLISRQVLRRAGLEHKVQPTTPVAITGLERRIRIKRKVQVTAFAANKAYSMRIECLVLDRPAFDLVLSRRFIRDNGVAFVNPALPLRASKLSEAELQQIQEDRKKKYAENERVAQQRKADDAARRAKLRAQKSQGGDSSSARSTGT